MYKIYNHSSESMKEIKDASIDLIIAGPPYNIGTVYGSNQDSMSIQQYIAMMNRIISECYRVITKKGTLVVESADTVLINGKYVQLAGLISSICIQNGFHLIERNFNFAASKDGVELLEHDWGKNYTTSKNSHSNCHQWMTFSKTKGKYQSGRIYYINYVSTREHPCPFPLATCRTFLKKYFHKGNSVLDPFMGTGVLGVEVLKRKGDFYGYELSPEIFSVAEANLRSR